MSTDIKKAKSVGSFQAMGLEKDLLKGLNRMGYQNPTPVQRKALPVVLAGVDMVCMARTGSGKTCVFLLPMIQKLKAHDSTCGVRAIVLSPTRELAVQSYKFAKDMAKFTDLRIASIIGGDSIESQFEALASHPDVIIATPGRLMHQLREVGNFKLKNVQYLVFDEADRLFEMGFAEQLNEIVRECPAERQTLLFSATMPKQLAQFARAGLRDPQLISLETDTKLSEELRTAFFYVRSNEKIAAFMYLVRQIIPRNQQTIVFTATKHHSELLHALLQKMGETSTIVYGSMDQDARSDNLRSFRNSEVNYLIVTDVAARGIDIPLLNNVINFHFPSAPKLFVHRCGRAARQGRIGFAMSLVEPEELGYMVDVHKLLGNEVVVPGSEQQQPQTEEGSNSLVYPPIEPYTMDSMTPSMIHTGLLPQDVLDEENEYLKKSLADDHSLAVQYRICENAMQQYRRTRSESTKEGIKIAKRLIKDTVIKELHPLIVGQDPAHCSKAVVAKQNFVRMLQTFRPAQTVFETGIGTGTGNAAIKNLSKAGTKEAKGVEMMRALRVTTAGVLERNKALRAAYFAKQLEDMKANDDQDNNEGDGNDSTGEEDGEGDREAYGMGSLDDFEHEEDDEFDGEEGEEEAAPAKISSSNGKSNKKSAAVAAASTVPTGKRPASADEAPADSDDEANANTSQKRRLTAAEKRRLKKSGQNLSSTSAAAAKATTAVNEDYDNYDEDDNHNNGRKRAYAPGVMGQFRDERFFMAYGDEDEKANFADSVLQPQSGLKSSEAKGAAMMEMAMLDIMPEDAVELNKKRRMLRWDAKKRKFVKQTLEEMSSSKTSSAKRIRSETGAIMSTSSKAQGEMYEAWKKKTKREVTLPGMGLDVDDRPRPNVKYNTNVKSELRSAKDIRQMKATRDDHKMKNMSKDVRKKVEGKKNKAKGKYVPDKIRYNTSGSNRKMKIIIR